LDPRSNGKVPRSAGNGTIHDYCAMPATAQYTATAATTAAASAPPPLTSSSSTDFAFEAIAGDGVKVTNTGTGTSDWIYTIENLHFADGTFAVFDVLP
jgi:hypothetical protein